MTGGRNPRWVAVAALLLLTLASAVPALAQNETNKPANCHAYKLDEVKNRIVFNDPKIIIMMPDKEDRVRLRIQGTPGQLFVMKNCDTPDFVATLPVFAEQDAGGEPAEKVRSAVRVLILEEKENWVRVKGHTDLWKGTGWVHLTDDLVLVKY